MNHDKARKYNGLEGKWEEIREEDKGIKGYILNMKTFH
jgi:hypothetical protein